MITLRNLQIDTLVDMFEAGVSFWSAALSATGIRTSVDGRFVHLLGPAAAFEVHLQRTGDRAGYHLDLEADDQGEEVERLVPLGARLVRRDRGGWVVLFDPAGLPLCVVTGAAPRTPLTERNASRLFLGAIFVDVPADNAAAEVAFWSAALGGTPRSVSDLSDPYLPIDGLASAGGPYALEVQRVGASPRYHVDLACDDVPAEAQRLVNLGASRVAEIEDWITLADPAGNLLCVVPS